MTDFEAILQGYPVYIATQEFPRKRHKKKRIDKKWRKRYGCYEINMMPHGQVIMMDDGVIWMTKRTWQELTKHIRRKARKNEQSSFNGAAR